MLDINQPILNIMSHTLAFYNVENLYDTINDKRTLDDDFTFNGSRSWNISRYKNKIIRIAKAISAIGEKETKKLPTFIGICEIENRKVIKDLLNELPSGSNYGYVHQDSLDERGIDTAFFYDKNKFLLEEKEFLRIPIFNSDGSRDFTRDITYAKGILIEKKTEIHFFVLHLPSKRDDDVNLPKRVYLLKELREKINAIFSLNENANIIIMGDFNENPTVQYVYQELGCSKTIEKLQKKEFFNPFENLFRQEHFSLFHNGKGELFDQIIFSQSFFEQSNSIQYINSEVFNAPFLQDTERFKRGTPWRTYSGTRYLGGYSDHFPVYGIIE